MLRLLSDSLSFFWQAHTVLSVITESGILSAKSQSHTVTVIDHANDVDDLRERLQKQTYSRHSDAYIGARVTYNGEMDPNGVSIECDLSDFEAVPDTLFAENQLKLLELRNNLEGSTMYAHFREQLKLSVDFSEAFQHRHDLAECLVGYIDGTHDEEEKQSEVQPQRRRRRRRGQAAPASAAPPRGIFKSYPSWAIRRKALCPDRWEVRDMDRVCDCVFESPHL
jgi:hypothetical protein